MSNRRSKQRDVTRRSFLQAAACSSALAIASRHPPARAASSASHPCELSADVLIIGGSFGGVAAALAAADRGFNVIITEETAWIGGQGTTQGVPLDEHPWIEEYGRTRTYAQFRNGVRNYYRRNYPLIPEARADRALNPGAGWVTALGYEPRVGLGVLHEMLAPHLSSGRIVIMTLHRPVAVEMDADRVTSVTLEDGLGGVRRTCSAPFVLDATELGELLELANIERMVGAESQAQTGEPGALEGPANPADQMGFTHVFAVDFLPDEEHVIEQPRGYEDWQKSGKLAVPDLFGNQFDHFGHPVVPGRYLPSTWSFRRILCRGNFEQGAFPSDVTVAIWKFNEYHKGVLCGVSAEERQTHLDAARQLSLSVLYWLQTEAPNPGIGGKGFPGLRPRGDVFGTQDGLAQYPYIRESCRIQAEFTVLEQHFRADTAVTRNGPVKYHDSVGVGGYRIDIHKPARSGQGSVTEANHGKHWCQQIPLGALLPVRVENLLPACKNLGVTAVTNGAFRLHPVEWNIGEAAGMLAAFCLSRHLVPRQVREDSTRLTDFQRELVQRGVELDWPVMHTSRSYFSHHQQELKDSDTFYFGEAWRPH